MRTIEGRGRALVAARSFSAGEAILAERPLVTAPMVTGGSGALACERCLAFVGPSSLHLELAAGRTDVEAARAEAKASGTCDRCYDCGAIYCCQACRRADLRRGHRLLCEGGPAAAAIRRFRQHAREDAELPEVELAASLLAALLAEEARGVQAALQEGQLSEEEKIEEESDGNEENSEEDEEDKVERRVKSEEALCTATIALGLVQEPLEDVLSRDAAGADAAKQTLADVSTSCDLLRQALLLSCAGSEVSPSRVRQLCRMQGLNSFGNLVAISLLNQVALTVSSPALQHIERLHAVRKQLQARAPPDDQKARFEARRRMCIGEPPASQQEHEERVLEQLEQQRMRTRVAATAELVGLLPLAEEARACRRAEAEEAGEAEEEGQALEVAEGDEAKEEQEEHDKRLSIDDLSTLAADLFPPLDATALVWYVCLMNHSCEPNAVVAYSDALPGGGIEGCPTSGEQMPGETPRSPALARIVALRDIAAGEEIVWSYIDCSETRRLRREGLAIYGIDCECERCCAGTD